MLRSAAHIHPSTRLAAALAACAALAVAGVARADDALPAVARGALVPVAALHRDPDGGQQRLLDAAAVRRELEVREQRRFAGAWTAPAGELPAGRPTGGGHPCVAAVASNTLDRGAIGPATVLLPAFVGRVVARLGVGSSLLLSRPARAAAAGHEVPAGLALAKKLPY